MKTSDNKIYLLRSLRCRGSSGARPYAPKMPSSHKRDACFVRHCEPLQAHFDLKGKRLLPIHNGTFDLSMHSWREPFDRIVAMGNIRGIPVITPMMGEPARMHATSGGLHWWEGPSRFKETEGVQVNVQPAGMAGNI